MTINFESITYEMAVSDINKNLTLAMCCCSEIGTGNDFDAVLASEEVRRKRFLKATIMDNHLHIPEFFNFFMVSVPALIFIAEVCTNSKNKVFYICY